MNRAIIALAVVACGGAGSDPAEPIDSGPAAADAFENSICVDPSSVTMESNLGFAGSVACVDTGARGAGLCPGVVVAGLCPPNVSLKEVAIFVRDDATGEGYVVMRQPITLHSHGTIGSDGESVRDIPDGVSVNLESRRADGIRARVVFRLDGLQVTVSELHHDAPL